MLLSDPIAEQDVVEEQLLHHRWNHPVALENRLMKKEAAQPTDFRSNANHESLLRMGIILEWNVNGREGW